MFNKIIAKLLNKKLYKSKITILDDEFTATHDSDSLLESLKWTLHGIYEANATQQQQENTKSNRGIFGQICEFKILSVSSSSISLLDYSKPKNEDMMFMSNHMVYIPQKILNNLKKQETSLADLDAMLK